MRHQKNPSGSTESACWSSTMKPTLVNCWSRCSEIAEPTRQARHRYARRWQALLALNLNVLISDIGMPDEDGYELIRKVRALGPGAGQIPAIALTAYARRADRHRALSAGYDLHLAKPVEPNDLARAVANLVKRRQG